jgi:anaerobic magnesium-protoporphyrin IX monomethyl ester cyclase
MRNICLIRPPRVLSEGSFTSGACIPPIGLAYLVSCLEQASFKVVPIDAVGEEIEQYYPITNIKNVIIQGMYLSDIVAKIPKDVFLIGVSCMFSCEWFLYEALIHEIKFAFPNIPIVVGGEHVTAEAANILKTCSSVDVCVSGEGENTIVELAEAYSKNESIKNIDGISYRSNDQVIKNKSRARIKDINTIPMPSWSNMPVHRYHQMGFSMASINRKAMPIIASRGCPYKCTFCTSPQMWGTDLFLRKPESIVEEIKFYKKNYDIEHIDFLDIVGVLNRAWVKELLLLMIKEKIDLTWLHGAGTRSEILDDEILKLFKESNALRIFYAPESGSKETLKRIKKRVNLDKITKSMKQAHKLNISTRAPLIYGFPDQTLKEAFQSLFFSFYLSYIGVDDVVAHAFSAHPGTELHNDLVKRGNIDVGKLIENHEYNLFLRNEFNNKMKSLHSWSSHIPSWSLPLFQYGGMSLSYAILFIFHPKKIFASLKRIFILKKPLTLFDHVLYSVFLGKKIKLSAAPVELYKINEKFESTQRTIAS